MLHGAGVTEPAEASTLDLLRLYSLQMRGDTDMLLLMHADMHAATAPQGRDNAVYSQREAVNYLYQALDELDEVRGQLLDMWGA